MLVKKLYLILFVLISSCGSITLPDTEVCAVSGRLSDGMQCSTTLSSQERDISFTEALYFLQPAENKGPALCQSSKDWTEFKTTLEAACLILGSRCKKELKKKIESFSNTIKSLSTVR